MRSLGFVLCLLLGLLTILTLDPSAQATAIWLPWRKKPTWVFDHFIKHGINEQIASAALQGLSDQQLLEMSQLEVRVLTKLLKSLQKTMDETKAVSHLILPDSTHLTESQRDTLKKATFYLAASMRRSVDVVFDAMEGKVKDRDMWTRAMKNAHHFVMRNVCESIGDTPILCHESKLHLPWHHQKVPDEL